MKLNIFLLSAVAGSALAYPGMGKLMHELMTRQGPPPTTPQPLFGDLATEGATTAVGQTILACITGQGPCQDTTAKTYVPPGELGSSACAADTCCVWDFVAQDLVKLFKQCDGTCGPLARSAIRFGFHDAAAWNLNADHGGADGSLFLNEEEITRQENRGLQAWHAQGNQLLAKYSSYGVGAADFAQFAHNVAVVVCPLGPRSLTYVGRENSDVAAITGQLPSPFSDADTLIKLFEDKSTDSRDLVALIGAHSTANQRFVDPSKAGQPLDSTPGVWDVKYYEEVLAGAPPPGVFRFQSDDNLGSSNRTRGGFVAFSTPTAGQRAWNAGYARAYTRMSIFGVNKINQLTDCTRVLPNAQPVFNGTGTGFTDPTCSSASSISSSKTSSVSESATKSSSRGPGPTGSTIPSGGPRPSGSRPGGGPKPSNSHPGDGPKPSDSHPGDGPKPSDSYPGGPKPSKSLPEDGSKPSHPAGGSKPSHPGGGEGGWPKPSGTDDGYPGGHPDGPEGSWPRPSGGYPGSETGPDNEYPGGEGGWGKPPGGYPGSETGPEHGYPGGEEHPQPPKPTGAPDYPAGPVKACPARKKVTVTVTEWVD